MFRFFFQSTIDLFLSSSYHNHYSKNMVLFSFEQISPFWDNHWIRIFVFSIYQIRILVLFYFILFRYLEWILNYHFFNPTQISVFWIFVIYLLVGYQQIWISKIQKFAYQLYWVPIFFFLTKNYSKGNIIFL
jgi:hypothetical protein